MRNEYTYAALMTYMRKLAAYALTDADRKISFLADQACREILNITYTLAPFLTPQRSVTSAALSSFYNNVRRYSKIALTKSNVYMFWHWTSWKSKDILSHRLQLKKNNGPILKSLLSWPQRPTITVTPQEDRDAYCQVIKKLSALTGMFIFGTSIISIYLLNFGFLLSLIVQNPL